MLSQAMRTLKMLFGYVRSKKSLLTREHRERVIDAYTAQEVYTAGGEGCK